MLPRVVGVGPAAGAQIDRIEQRGEDEKQDVGNALRRAVGKPQARRADRRRGGLERVCRHCLHRDRAGWTLNLSPLWADCEEERCRHILLVGVCGA